MGGIRISADATELTCRVCGKTKPIEDFCKNNRNKLGRSRLCKECKNEEDRRYHEKIYKDPERRKIELEKRREWKNAHREQVRLSAFEYNNRPEVKERKLEWARNHMNITQLTEKQYIHKMWRNAKSRAERDGLPFNIEESDIVIPKCCPILCTALILNKNYKYSNPEHTPSLDKINPKLGYVKGNVQVISFKANTMKNSATIEELKWFCLNIPKYMNFKIEDIVRSSENLESEELKDKEL